METESKIKFPHAQLYVPLLTSKMRITEKIMDNLT